MNISRGIRDLAGSTVGYLPVRVQAGPAKGARWTLFPRTSYWRGTHELWVQGAIEALGILRGWSCWDLGADFGFYSVMLALRTGPEGEVAAFEPNPRSFGRLRLHARMNGLGWLKCYRSAASDSSGSSELMTYGDLGSTSTHLLYDGEVPGKACLPIEIQTLRLDDEVEAGRLRLPRFIKMDVEGHGHRALRGMARTLEKARPQLIIAFHSDAEVEGCLAILEPLGYRHEPVGVPSRSDSLVGGDFLFRPTSGNKPQDLR
jgi:FkbM family methyltransferase